MKSRQAATQQRSSPTRESFSVPSANCRGGWHITAVALWQVDSFWQPVVLSGS
jgi:hypothetical protein